jgi:protocatechuate 3,4-dioxygenase beta subunit
MNSLRMLITIDVRTYRPEKYYMRDPGPKWREKHACGRVSALS